MATCVYWKWTTEIFQWVRACTESAPSKYFRGYVLVLKQHHQNISVAMRTYWNCYTEIFLGLRACTVTAVLKYSVSTRVYWNCIALLKFFSVYPCVLQLHYSNISVWTCQYWNISMPTTTKLAVLKHFSVNPESITLNCVLNFSGGTACSQNIASSIYTDCIT